MSDDVENYAYEFYLALDHNGAVSRYKRQRRTGVSMDIVAAASPRTTPAVPTPGFGSFVINPWSVAPKQAPTQTKLSKEDVVKAYQELGGTWAEVERIFSGVRAWELSGRAWDQTITVDTRAYGEDVLQAYRSSALELLKAVDLKRPYHKPARAGINNSAHMQCKRSQYHGFHPVDEKCPLCP